MTSQPDNLFREKLENFQRPASVAAWERIESGLNKNQTKGLWLKVAAGLSLLAIATYILLPTNQIETQQQASTAKEVTPKTELERNTSEKALPVTPAQEHVSQRASTKNKFSKKTEPVLTAQSTNEVKDAVVPVIESSNVQVAVVETNTNETAPSRTIVYTAEEVNAKFLRKKSPVEATASTEKSSGIQKLMGLAYTLKNPDNGLGDLRQKKDEILALNFLAKEDKTNKEKN